LLASLREHSLLVTIIAAYMICGAALPRILGRPFAFALSIGDVSITLWTIAVWVLVAAFVIEVIIETVRAPRHGALRRVWSRISSHHLRADRLAGGFIVLVLFPPFAWNFAFIKALLPILHPFNWDPTFAAWDKWLHLGREPWEWLQPIFGHPMVTSLTSIVYALWFLVLYGVTVWQAFARRDPVLRMQYFLCSVLVWILMGNVAATLLASGGPVYYGRLTGLPDPYAPLLGYLHAVAAQWPVWSVDVQEAMWGIYAKSGDSNQVAVSISAMPSMHVAMACTFFLAARATDRRLGFAFGLFLLAILFGSVHLGWHYAIDGYAGILGTFVLWAACGWLLRRPAVQWMLWGSKPTPDRRAARSV
jgi:hypothetical protein